MRAAIDAQILSERTGDLNRINQILNEFKGTNHDAGNALSGVMLNLPLFQKIVQEPGLSKEKLDKAAKIAEMLNLSLQNLKDLLQTSRDKIRSHANDLSYIYPHQIITQVIEELQMQFPLITFSYDIELSLKSLNILFFGGNTALTRIFNNILLNACQGNGLESATTIEVTTLFLADCNELVFKIQDNGPGFTSLYLNKATQIYSTTKVNGSGLGLYTTRQLLLANNSSITLCNRDDAKGALVTIHLSLERSS
jgi:nitrogen fixation/metabolism regulation signal transduction histidine kinase